MPRGYTSRLLPLFAVRRGISVKQVPNGLRKWFVVHFVVDVLAALPLMVAPGAILRALGWSAVDPIASRLVAASLLGIGIESWLGRNSGPESFQAMLNLKLIWSGAAIIGVAWALFEGGPPVGWVVLIVFAGFNAIWVRYRFALHP